MKNVILAAAMLLMSAVGCAQGEKEVTFKDARLVNMEGDSISLSQYVGKHDYVLVDWPVGAAPACARCPT